MDKQTIKVPSSEDIIDIFNQTFYQMHNTKLVSGGNEPLYLPASEECNHHQIIFTHDYFASALHEIAHWLVAGETRRLQVDYGYWYEPDGRGLQQQAEFETVEILPQAIEWALSVSCGSEFDVSSDNLSGIAIFHIVFLTKLEKTLYNIRIGQ